VRAARDISFGSKLYTTYESIAMHGSLPRTASIH
jgi:hypothetical protein